jgi:hypothetical protein
MRVFLLLLPILGLTTALPQINFADNPRPAGIEKENRAVNFNQVENQVFTNAKESIYVAEYSDDNDFDIIEDINEDISENTTNQDKFCCCIPGSDTCNEKSEEQDLVGVGDINVRIVNRPPVDQQSSNSCLPGQKICCQDLSVDLSVFGRSTCASPLPVVQQSPLVSWTQGCTESLSSGSQGCGTRLYEDPAQELAHGESSPGEFPWTCLVLNQNNDFIGSCVVIPNDSRNDNNLGTRKILTAAHKLSNVGPNDIIKVRVGEYDARGLNLPERIMHEEYTVTHFLTHPDFNPKRLSNDLAILYADKEINLNHPGVNTACLPSCSNQFQYQFVNGTGIRCWVAGRGKNEFDGSFQPVQHKVDLPIVGARQCNRALKVALNDHQEGVGDAFNLDESEMCAGGEEGKDACTGDGGSPLVCEAKSGRWTVVGLVTWGIGCASDMPGVYARLSHFKDWINAN